MKHEISDELKNKLKEMNDYHCFLQEFVNKLLEDLDKPIYPIVD